jgi:hypothetical protein
MDGRAAILNQLNIIAGDMRASIDFHRKLGVQMPEPAGTKEAAPFHVNGEAADGFDLDLDSAQSAQVWDTGWTGRDDLAGRSVSGVGDSRLEVAMILLTRPVMARPRPALRPPVIPHP